MEAKLEYVGPDEQYPGSKIYRIKAITVTRSGNGRLYTKDELIAATKSLSFRPLDINHDHKQELAYPENSTLHPFEFNSKDAAVVGAIRVKSPEIISKIDSGQISKLSVEQVSNEMLSSDGKSKIQYGMAFTGLALLDGYLPGDPKTEIEKMETLDEKFVSIKSIYKREQSELVDDLVDDIMDDREDQIKAQAAVVDALKGKLALDPTNQDIQSQLEQARQELEWMVLAYQDIDKDERSTSQIKSVMSELQSAHPDWPQDQKVATCMKRIGQAKLEKLKSSLTKSEPKTSQNMEPQSSQAAPSKSSQGWPVMSPQQWEEYKNIEQKKLETLTKTLTDQFIPAAMKPYIDQVNEMQARWKKESVVPSSKVTDDPVMKQRKEEYDAVVSFFDRIHKNPKGENNAAVTWTLDKQALFEQHAREGPTVHVPLGKKIKAEKTEGVTINSGDQGQIYTKTILVVPGGRMKVPVRQYCYFQSVADGADRAHFYSIPAFDFGTITEGTEPTNPSQTVTKNTAITASRGAVQRVGYSQIEAAPYGLVDAINVAMLIAAMQDEAVDLLSTVYHAISTPSNWIRGDTGAATNTSNISSLGAMTRIGVAQAKALLRNQGYDVSPGNLVLFLHPTAYEQLITDSNLVNYTQFARPEITSTEMMEMLYGVDIVITNAVQGIANSTNPNAWENVMAVKGVSFGMASGRDLTLEAQRRNEVQQVVLSGTQRVKSVVIEETATCRITSKQ